MSYPAPFGRVESLPATIITPSGPIGVSNEINFVGANGTTGTFQNSVSDLKKVDEESDDDEPESPDIPLTFDQEQNLLMRMNEQQGKTIEELQKRIKALEKELVEKPIPPICYVSCPHCYEEDKQVKK
jgi:hypothetical protein